MQSQANMDSQGSLKQLLADNAVKLTWKLRDGSNIDISVITLKEAELRTATKKKSHDFCQDMYGNILTLQPSIELDCGRLKDQD